MELRREVGELSAMHPRHGAVVLAEEAPALLATFHADPGRAAS
jgi:hypothetical protein